MSHAIVWFRRDLRLSDNPALVAALAHHSQVIPVYIHAPGEQKPWQPGAASGWWLHHSLVALDRELRTLGSRLVIRRGPTCLDTLRELVKATGATDIYWNRLYEPRERDIDAAVRHGLQKLDARAHSSCATFLYEPGTILKQDGNPYRVFTPYWKTCLKRGTDTDTLPAPRDMPPVDDAIDSLEAGSLGLLPEIHWDREFPNHWHPGENGAHRQLQAFTESAALDYDEQRDRPGHTGTSGLSAHLHFGEISPRQVVATIYSLADRVDRPGAIASIEAYVRELGWREFAGHLLHHYPDTPDRPLDARFEQFPWRDDFANDLCAWQQGQTGIPIVDAGMRQLWQTGWMHNRVRMIAASYLVKNLLVPWQEGARWFWDTLVDADLASNTMGWQWVAGCGADAAPYFRIFNPVTQAQKFDPAGTYIRRWVPEIASLPDRQLACPWDVPAGQRPAGYPEPAVDLKTSRARALASFQAIRNAPGRP